MTESKYYNLPVLEEYNNLRPGMTVEYVGPMPLDGPLTLTELVRLDYDMVTAILNDGELECDADNLRAAEVGS